MQHHNPDNDTTYVTDHSEYAKWLPLWHPDITNRFVCNNFRTHRFHLFYFRPLLP